MRLGVVLVLVMFSRVSSTQILRNFGRGIRLGHLARPPSITSSFALFSSEVAGGEEGAADKVALFKRGDKITAVVTQFGPLGASVTVDGGKGYGLVLQSEIAMYRDKNGIDVVIGDSLDAFVERVRDDGKLHVFLRPVDVARLGSVADQVMEALEGSPDQVIPVGDKSSPEDIGSYFYGVSKRDFKNAVGTLYKDGKARPGPFTTALIGDEDREAFLAEKAERQAKSKQGSSRFEGAKHDQEKTIFVGNLPFETNDVILTNTVLKILGPDKHASVRLAMDPETGRSRGFGYVEMKDKADVEGALESLRGVEVMGRNIRTDYAGSSRAAGAGAGAKKENKWVDFLNNGEQEQEQQGRGERRARSGSYDSARDSARARAHVAASLYMGNLPYSATSESIREFLGSCEGLDMAAVGNIRMGTGPDGRSKGFCHVDFHSDEGAKAVFEGLHHQEIEGRRVHIDEATRKLQPQNKSY